MMEQVSLLVGKVRKRSAGKIRRQQTWCGWRWSAGSLAREQLSIRRARRVAGLMHEWVVCCEEVPVDAVCVVSLTTNTLRLSLIALSIVSFSKLTGNTSSRFYFYTFRLAS